MKREPINYVVQIGDRYLAELIYYWIYYDKPCTLRIIKPETEGLVGVKLIIDSDQAADFLQRVKDKTGCKTFIE